MACEVGRFGQRLAELGWIEREPERLRVHEASSPGARTRRSSRATAGPSGRSRRRAARACVTRMPGQTRPLTPRKLRARALARLRPRKRRTLQPGRVAPTPWRSASRPAAVALAAAARRSPPATQPTSASPRRRAAADERTRARAAARRRRAVPFAQLQHQAAHRRAREPLERGRPAPLLERLRLGGREAVAPPALLDLERAARPAHRNPVEAQASTARLCHRAERVTRRVGPRPGV